MVRGQMNSGFTLVELMVVIAIIAAIIAIALPTLMSGRQKADAVICMNNLNEIFNSIVQYKLDRGLYPDESGIRFFLQPWHRKTIEQDPKTTKIYVCPGDEPLLQRIGGDYSKIYDELIDNWDRISSEFTSYSGRDQKQFPINPSRLAREPIVCDDDEDFLNHPNQINVLYMSGDIEKIFLDDLGEDEPFLVGEGSPIEKLEVLSNE